MKDNKIYLTAKQIDKLILKNKFLLKAPNSVYSNILEFIKNKFNDEYLFENEFKDDLLLLNVFKILSLATFGVSDYFLLVDLFNTIKPSTDIEKEIFLDLCRVLIKSRELDISLDLIKDYYNSYINKDYFYRSINVIINEIGDLRKSNNQRHYEHVIRFLINIRSNFINEDDYFSYSYTAFLTLNNDECIFEDEVLKNLNIKKPKIYKGFLKAGLNTKNTQVKFIENIYGLLSQNINKNQLLELRNNLEAIKSLNDMNEKQEESINALDNFIYFIEILDRIENYNKKDTIDYKSKYEEIINSDDYKNEEHPKKFDLILKNILLNKNLLLIGNPYSGRFACCNQVAKLLNKKRYYFHEDKLNDYDFLSNILGKDVVVGLSIRNNAYNYEIVINNFLNMVKENKLYIDNKKIEVNPNLNIIILSEKDLEINNVTKIELSDDYIYVDLFGYKSKTKKD